MTENEMLRIIAKQYLEHRNNFNAIDPNNPYRYKHKFLGLIPIWGLDEGLRNTHRGILAFQFAKRLVESENQTI